MRAKLREYFYDEAGMGTVEMILIIVVLDHVYRQHSLREHHRKNGKHR